MPMDKKTLQKFKEEQEKRQKVIEKFQLLLALGCFVLMTSECIDEYKPNTFFGYIGCVLMGFVITFVIGAMIHLHWSKFR